MPALCRDCLAWHDPAPARHARCPACRGPRLVAHGELGRLAIAHVDADAFYASVEKRDRPELADRPLIVGGGRRGVVTTCCYIARIAGVRSAMPMFKALKLCPDAEIIRPRMEVYAGVSREIRARMEALTPLVEPLSLDEAFLDLSGTERLLGMPPAAALAGLASAIEHELGISVSIGLSHNKFLAKMASDLDKPRGFSVIGAAETLDFLGPRPVRSLWGVGAALAGRLEADGYRRIADLRAAGEARLAARYGAQGKRLAQLSEGRDARRVSPDRPMKSISAETTFDRDLSGQEPLEGHLWRLAVRVSDRAKAKETVGATVTLRLKTAGFRGLTRQTGLGRPSNLAEEIYGAAERLLGPELGSGPFRLIGVGISALSPAGADDSGRELFDDPQAAQARAERVTDLIRKRFGSDTIFRGRALR
ncbi:DNA polymerase IV [Paralimibaculum aggregatum]|uniref:DNA polymerase IV n=1 Tax=Paralimibaculum aggregatum TaxID=3036245 RepID=A0ABQ6LEC7_9RHOB|nr:DNA polymerase IV [Limibaculum sp. NKW23]GMG81693.1 DNA polymerase IV [Limibaculum sp. NKW23]